MTENMLKLNDDKTEVLVITGRQYVGEQQNTSVKIGEIEIHPTKSARNLGVIFDNGLSLEEHIDKVCKTCYLNIRNIYQVRRYLTENATKSIVQSLVINRLDYANLLLYNLQQYSIKKLQKVQNAAARLVCKVGRREHISPRLYELHWLKVKYRIQYKLNTLTYACIKGMAPQYLCDLLQIKEPERNLRSSAEIILAHRMDPTKLRQPGLRAFMNASVVLWNKLPTHVKNVDNITIFKKCLKTYLFQL